MYPADNNNKCDIKKSKYCVKECEKNILLSYEYKVIINNTYLNNTYIYDRIPTHTHTLSILFLF